MEMPSTIPTLWAQRCRWARGQGEVLHTHLRTVLRWRNRRMWLFAIEASASLFWVIAMALALVTAAVNQIAGQPFPLLGSAVAWGIAIAVVATIQLCIALAIERPRDRSAVIALFRGAAVSLGYWAITASDRCPPNRVATGVERRQERANSRA